MKNNLLKSLAYALFPVLVMTGFVACHPAKKTAQKKIVPKEAPVAFSVDTICQQYRITPKQGHTIVIENLQVHITSNTQPGVGVAITRADSSRSNVILPFIANMNVYSYGGMLNLTLKTGDVAVIDAADVMSGKPLQARFIISGSDQKN